MCKDDIPTLSNLTLTFENISKLALEVGFDACGVAPVHRLDDDAQFMDITSLAIATNDMILPC